MLARISEWVEREVHRAEIKGKQILPLLLDGDPFFRFGTRQYDDVTDGSMPDDGFMEWVRRLTSG